MITPTTRVRRCRVAALSSPQVSMRVRAFHSLHVVLATNVQQCHMQTQIAVKKWRNITFSKILRTSTNNDFTKYRGVDDAICMLSFLSFFCFSRRTRSHRRPPPTKNTDITTNTASYLSEPLEQGYAYRSTVVCCSRVCRLPQKKMSRWCPTHATAA